MESKIQQDIRLALSELHAGMFLRYQVGTFIPLNSNHPIKIGVVGASDLIGIVPHVVTAEDVGKTIGVFCAIEVKNEGRDTTDKDRKVKQAAFRKVVRGYGGIAGVAKSVPDAVALATEKWNSEPHNEEPRL